MAEAKDTTVKGMGRASREATLSTAPLITVTPPPLAEFDGDLTDWLVATGLAAVYPVMIELSGTLVAENLVVYARQQELIRDRKIAAACTTRSRTVGIPSGRCFPSGLGIHTRRTACGR